MTAIAIVSGIVLSRNDAQGSNTLRVDVMAQQFTFTFSYPDAKNVTSSELRLPQGRSVELYIRSKDVIHSVWVPQFGQKIDAVPGLVTHLHITPDRLGTFPLECTELCGLGHAGMRSQAIVMQPKSFASWLHKQEKPPNPSTPVSGLEVFRQNGCGSCHTLTAAATHGKVAPDLDKLASYAQQAHKPLAAFVRESIVNPNAYVQPGFPANVMPQNFSSTISKDELNALVQFLVQASKKG